VSGHQQAATLAASKSEVPAFVDNAGSSDDVAMPTATDAKGQLALRKVFAVLDRGGKALGTRHPGSATDKAGAAQIIKSNANTKNKSTAAAKAAAQREAKLAAKSPQTEGDGTGDPEEEEEL
jgi:hypothetical protein